MNKQALRRAVISLFGAAAFVGAPLVWAQSGPIVGVSVDAAGKVLVASTVVTSSSGQTLVSYRMTTTGFVFPAGGVSVEGGAFTCAVVEGGRVARCRKVGAHEPGKRYAVQLQVMATGGGSMMAPGVDIWIQND